MADFKRFSLILMTSVAGATLAACDGASSVASPGPGTIVIPPGGSSTPTPSTPTPTPSPAASFTETTVNAVTVTRDEQLAVFNAGTNNTVAGSNPLNGLIAQGAAAGVTPFNASALNSFFVNTSFIGAIGGAGDTAFQNWTCNSTTANFGASPAPAASTCLSSLSRSAAAPAASACPAGTTDAGTASNYRLCRLPALISGTVTLNRVDGVAYQIHGRVDVGVDTGISGSAPGGAAATLNVGAGALFVSNNADSANDFLVVNRGSKLNAIGTASAPIIFTSGQNLNPSIMSEASQGQWGGIILAGRAPISNCASGSNSADGSSTTCEATVEGTGNALYGGNVAADSSGTVQYVQIRYSGIEITPNNELQGLTLGGTGSGTVIDHIQVHNSSDDGIEVFGGTTNMKYLAITGADDDGLDTDMGWRGFIQFAIVVQKAGGATNDAFSMEIDSNNNEDALPRQFGRIANFTFIHTASATPAAIRLRGGADYTFVNGIVKAVGPCINLVAGATTTGGKTTIRPADPALQEEGPPKFNSVYLACNGA